MKLDIVINKNWKEFAKTVESTLKKNGIPFDQIQKKVKTLTNKAEKDFYKVMDKDLPKMLKNFRKEKQSLEKMVEATIQDEIKKAKKFIDEHKKELNKLQDRVEKYAMKTSKTASKTASTARKKATKAAKKATKKVAKVTKKKTTKKKATKKTTKKKAVSKKKTTKKKQLVSIQSLKVSP